MTWAAVGVGAVSLVGGMVQWNQASKKQKGALNAQMSAEQANLAFQQQIYDEEKAFNDPMRNQLREQVLSDDPLYYAQMRDQISKNYGLAERGQEAAASRNGTLGSGFNSGSTRSLLLSQAGDLSRAWQSGMANKNQLALNMLGQDKRMGAAAGVGQAYQGMANVNGQNAAMYGQAAQAGYSSAMQGLVGAITAYGTRGEGSGASVPDRSGEQRARDSQLGLGPSPINPVNMTPQNPFSGSSAGWGNGAGQWKGPK